MKLIQLNVMSQTKLFYNGEAKAVFVPTVEGELKILPRHMPLIAKLKPGIVRIVLIDSEEHVDVQGGFLNVTHEKTSVIVF
ncbi:MAG: ATP synthase epsilon chain [Holosporales bacterium]